MLKPHSFNKLDRASQCRFESKTSTGTSLIFNGRSDIPIPESGQIQNHAEGPLKSGETHMEVNDTSDVYVAHALSCHARRKMRVQVMDLRSTSITLFGASAQSQLSRSPEPRALDTYPSRPCLSRCRHAQPAAGSWSSLWSPKVGSSYFTPEANQCHIDWFSLRAPEPDVHMTARSGLHPISILSFCSFCLSLGPDLHVAGSLQRRGPAFGLVHVAWLASVEASLVAYDLLTSF